MAEIERVVEQLDRSREFIIFGKGMDKIDCVVAINEAIQTIRELSALTKGLSNPMYEIGYEKGASDMQKAKQIIIDKMQNQITKWYLCSEKMPEDYENVLVDCDYFRYVGYNDMVRHNILVAYHSRDVWHIGFEAHELKIHAWCELPKLEGVE